MSQPPFEIAVRGNTLHAQLRGFWSLATADAYAGELLRAARSLGTRQTYWLVDCANFPIQSAAVVERMTSGVSVAKQFNMPIVAILSSSALTALQARRAGREADQAHFTSAADAEVWLRAKRTAANSVAAAAVRA